MLRKPTQALRMTLTQEARPVLGPEEGAPARATRKVSVYVPESPQCFIWLDDPSPLALGPNRTYDMPVFPPNAERTFELLPGQVIYGATREGLAHGAIVVEYR